MGQEVSCTLIRGRTRHAGRAHLEGDHLLFRGEAERVKVVFKDLTKVSARAGRLSLTSGSGTITLELGAVAETWAGKILNPRSLMDKLGVKPGMRVAVVDVEDADVLRQLRDVCSDVRVGTVPRDSDVILFGVERALGLRRLGTLKGLMKPAGAIWVVHRKGKDATLRDVEVFAAAKEAGLVDNKVASFSATHTAERLVIPVRDRPKS
ncbi:MAG: hypothetical protein U0132_04665 [Gemmatimonadaceae bacterium]